MAEVSNQPIDVFRAEIYFLLAAGTVMLGCYCFLPTLPPEERDCAWLFIIATLSFWTFSMRGISLMLQGVAQQLAAKASLNQGEGPEVSRTGAIKKVVFGATIKLLAVGILVVLFARLGSCGAKWFFLITVAHFGVGSFFLVLVELFRKKNK